MKDIGDTPFCVLHVMGTLANGGISSVVLNYYSLMDHKKVRFDIAVTSDSFGSNADRFRSLGSRIYTIPKKSQGIKAYTDALTQILSKTKYDAIHVHERDTSYVALRTAKKLGVKKRIAHAHSARPIQGGRDRVRQLASAVLNPLYATDLLACGILAGERTFGRLNTRTEKFRVLPNAVDTARFAFQPEVRAVKRKELGVEGRFVLGMVGRLAPVKNIPFAIQLIGRLRQRMPDAVLIIVGDGSLKPVLEQMVQKSNLEDAVHFLGLKADPENYYQAFDVMLLPSFEEGFPVSAIEAMSSGLPVLLSDTITAELGFSSAVRYCPLGVQDQWLENLIRLREHESDHIRKARQHEVKDNGYEIGETVKLLEEIYGIN